MTMPDIHSRIRRTKGGNVGWVTVDNRARLNILDSTLITRFSAVLERLRADASLRALVVRGAGDRAFVGGADICEMATFDPKRARDFIEGLHRLCRRIRMFPVPTIARISGYCLGAGMEIAASCDLRVASPDAKFGMPEVRVGIPSVIEAALLPGIVGWGHCRELLLTGDIVDGKAAHSMGFVQRVVPAEELDDAVDGWLDSVLSAGPRAVLAQKELLHQWERSGLEEAIQAGIERFSEAFRTSEPNRMMRRFLDRRTRQRRNGTPE